jgi:MFS family permease
MTSLMTLYALAMPIGILGAGPLLDAFGVEPVFAIAALIQTLTMAGVALAARAASPMQESYRMGAGRRRPHAVRSVR